MVTKVERQEVEKREYCVLGWLDGMKFSGVMGSDATIHSMFQDTLRPVERCEMD